MLGLKLLVSSIVNDLIDARFEADVRAAEIAKRYRDNESLRTLSVPTLNIDRVSIDIKFVFDDTPIDMPEKPTDRQVEVVAASAKGATTQLMQLGIVNEVLNADAQRNNLIKAFNSAINKAMLENFNATPEARKAALNTGIYTALRDATSVASALSRADHKLIIEQINAMEAAFVNVPPPVPKTMPTVMVGSGAIANARPEAVSSIQFEVDLAERRWTEVSDSDPQP